MVLDKNSCVAGESLQSKVIVGLVFALCPADSCGRTPACRNNIYPDTPSVSQVPKAVSGAACARTDLFSGPENRLLQAELTEIGLVLVRSGFVLTLPSKPGAPPAE
jgi:hypothetical protein